MTGALTDLKYIHACGFSEHLHRPKVSLHHRFYSQSFVHYVLGACGYVDPDILSGYLRITFAIWGEAFLVHYLLHSS